MGGVGCGGIAARGGWGEKLKREERRRGKGIKRQKKTKGGSCPRKGLGGTKFLCDLKGEMAMNENMLNKG